MNASTHESTWKRGSAAADLEREGDQLRADMDRTLDDIERELSPRKLMDRSMEFFREHGSDFVREAGETIRRNPVPVLLTAAGVVWLTAAIASSRSESPRRRQWNGARWNEEASHIDEDMADFDEFSAGHGYARTSRESGRTGAYTGTQSSEEWHEESHLTRLVREQPVALGALALAAGALLGAALPMTDYENRMMGPARDRSLGRDRGDMRRQNEENREPASSARANPNDPTMIDE